MATLFDGGAGRGFGVFGLLTLATPGVGKLTLAWGVGQLHRTLRMDSGNGVRFLAADRANPANGRLMEERLGLPIILQAHDDRRPRWSGVEALGNRRPRNSRRGDCLAPIVGVRP
jgi:hypothetical protein